MGGSVSQVAAGLALAAALSAGVWWFGHTRYEAGAASVRSELTEASAIASEQARIMSRDRAATATRIDHEVIAKDRLAADAAAARRVDGDGLRVALHSGQPATGPDAAECGAERARARLLEDLLDSGSRLVEEGAAIVDAAVNRIDGLQERERAP